MSEINKYFLQYMLNNGAVKYDNVNELLNQYADKLNISHTNAKTVLTEINRNIQDHSFRIDTRVCEVTGAKMCIFINTGMDEISKTATMFTQVELDLFESIITAIMESDTKSMSSITCLNLTSRLKPVISKDVAQTRIDLWISSGYLVKMDGMLYLGTRTISEFDVYLKGQFPRRMTNCKLCTDLVYYGKVCARCNEVLHVHCITRHLNKNQKCPFCKKPWEEANGRTYDSESDNEKNDEENGHDESMDTDD